MIIKLSQHKNKEFTYKKCFALFPIKIDNYLVWLSPYYKTWDFDYIGGGCFDYTPRRFIFKDDVVKYIKNKEEHMSC